MHLFFYLFIPVLLSLPHPFYFPKRNYFYISFYILISLCISTSLCKWERLSVSVSPGVNF